MNKCKWAVIATCKASKFEPEFERIVAIFERPILAEEFIEKCLPAETKDRFTIKHIE